MGEKTGKNLKLAFQGEAEAYFRNRAFAVKADREELPQIARLFRAMAEAQAIHAMNMLRLRKITGNTEENLERTFGTEEFAIKAYSELLKVAEEEGERAVAAEFSRTRDVEEGHRKLYEKAIANLLEDSESTYHVCKICGYVTDSEPEDRCPVCNAKKEAFFTVD